MVDRYLNAAEHLPGLVGYAYDRALRGVQPRQTPQSRAHRTSRSPQDQRSTRRPVPRLRNPPSKDRPPTTHRNTPRRRRTPRADLKRGRQPDPPTTQTHTNQQTNQQERRHHPTLRRIRRHHQRSDQRVCQDPTRPDQRRPTHRLHRPEHLRAFPENDPLFEAVQKPLRASAESANRSIDDHHPRERLHHYGFKKNHLSMLAWQAYRNSQTESVFMHRSRSDTPSLRHTG